MMNKSVKIVEFSQFVRVPLLFYKLVGIEPFRDKESQFRSRLLNFLFYFQFINMNTNVILGVLYPYYEGDFENVLEFAGILSCLGFCLVASCKLIAVWFNKATFANLIHSLENMFPTDSIAQNDYKAYGHLRRLSNVTVLFSTVYIIQGFIFSMFCLIFSTVRTLFLGKDFDKPLPYLIWYPWNEKAPTIYPFIYFSQVLATFTSVVAVMAGDLLLYSVVTQLCMHFEHITKFLREVKPHDTWEDNKKLNKLVKRHTLTLKLCEDLNNSFSFSILCNFMTSSFILCMVGFQLIIGGNTFELFSYCMYMSTSLTQVFLICHFGERLQKASIDVAYAAYSLSSMDFQLSYKKSISLIIQRAQKPAQLKPATFPPVTLETFSKVMRMSYQVFALLRTMYD